MIKKLLLASILALTSPSIIGMNAPLSKITYQGPQPALDNKETEINAKYDNDAIGWIVYKYDGWQKAEIILFEVDSEWRNHKKEHVGYNLFRQFMDDARKHQCKQICWTINPLDDLDTKTLVSIYKKIISKLPYSSDYTVTESDAYGPELSKVDMTLLLQK